MINLRMDQSLFAFDPETGIYQSSFAGAGGDAAASDSSFDKFYFMYSDVYGSGSYDKIPERVIKQQSSIDESRLAAALEMHQRATGEYPETLDAVSATFGGTLPRDIATGQPYFYQRDADGGYTLWGTGIDGRSDGGNEKSDVTWKHRPVKGK